MSKRNVTRNNQETVAVLHNIRSVHNVGSIFRTADGAGISKLYLCGITPTPLDRFGKERADFKKVSLGAEVPWEYQKSATVLLRRLKKEGYTIVAVEQSQRSVAYNTFRVQSRKIALVFGNEVRGLSSSVFRAADIVLEVPMRGALLRQTHHPKRSGRGKESLNVAVVFGIVAYRLLADQKKRG